MTSTDTIHLWTDGACRPNPGPGGWAYFKTLNGQTRSRAGSVAGQTTINQMHLVAAIQGLRGLTRRDLPTVVHTDSKYLSDGMTFWLAVWIAGGWRNSDRKPVGNRELWECLKTLQDERGPTAAITFEWVRGHSGVLMNERADELAEAAALRAVRACARHGTPPRARFDARTGLVVAASAQVA